MLLLDYGENDTREGMHNLPAKYTKYLPSPQQQFINFIHNSFFTLGTVQSLFYNMAGAKCNAETTFLSLYRIESTIFMK